MKTPANLEPWRDETPATRADRLTQGCESEQLHLSGAIQPYGAMLGVHPTSRRILHASINLGQFIGTEASALIGRSIDECGWLPLLNGWTSAEAAGQRRSLGRVIDGTDGRIDATLIVGKELILIELERNDTLAEPIALHDYQRPLMTIPHDSSEFTEYHQILLRSFRAIAGFHRVMIYRFQEDWSGEVIAEMTAPGIGSYLGLRFPASDIPAIARNLYLINPSRMIPDAHARPVPVLSLESSPPDMTWSDLRSVSPAHLQYLTNMGVGASFSVPVRVAGKLWALVACHHLQPLVLSPEQRNACVALAGTYAMGVTSHIASRRLQMIDSLERRVDHVLEALSDYADPLDGIGTNHAALLEIMGACGIAMAVSNEVVIAGEGPDLDGISHIDTWFMNEFKETIFCCDRLAGLLPDQTMAFSAVSGVMAIKARSPRSGWVRLYWFRPAETQEVAWAGNPNKPAAENPSAVALSPRRSFERWVEIRNGSSRTWTNEDRIVASRFRSSLLRWI